MDVSFQLYSARDAGPWPETLKHLAAAGYTQVEGFAGVYGDAAGFKGLLAGAYDDLPEQAFYMVGPMEEAQEKAIAMAKDVEG